MSPMSTMKKFRLAVVVTLSCVAVALLTAGAGFAAGPYQITGTAVSHDGILTRTEYTVSASANPLDRFKMVRLAATGATGAAGALRGSILLLPPLGTTFDIYEQRDENGVFGTSAAEYFALHGLDVYGYSPRYGGIPAGTCEAGLVDCSIMSTWNLQSQVDDVAFVRSRIAALHPGTRIVVGGVSLGCMMSIAVVNAHPGDYDGVVTWEGLLYSTDAQVRALNQGYCAAAQGQLAAGVFYDGASNGVLKQVTTDARLVPTGLTANPLFPPAFTNHQVLVATVAVPTPGPASMTVPNEVLMNGDLAEDRLFFASEPRLFEDVSRFANYAPVALLADITCSIAGEQAQYTSNLGNFKGPLLAIGGGHAFGAYMGDQLALFGSASKTFRLQPGFGHIDHFMTPDHRQYVEDPILDFTLRVVGR
jgi:pimeloyl-ACP methyl ester carboxylesterase